MANKLQKIIEGSINSLTSGGGGIINRLIGKPLLVYHTIPNEVVKVLTKSRKKEGILAELQEVIEASPFRVVPQCPLAGQCGGCKWQHIDYLQQLTIKKELIQKTFAAKQISLPDFTIVCGEKELFYRNRMDFMFCRNGELGLKEAGRWWAVVDLPECFLMSKEANEILSRLRVWTKNSGLPFWDNKKHEGFWRAAVIREGKNTGERLVAIITNRNPEAEKLIKELSDVIGDLTTSIVWGINERITDLSDADEIISIKVNPWLIEEINGLKYQIAPCSFFQTNSDMAKKLQDTVLELVEPKNKTVADFYCGAGFFSLALVKTGAKKVVGVEADMAGIAAAKNNARINNLKADFFAAKIEDYFKDETIAQNFNTIILDPPRAGLHPKVIEILLKTLPSTIVYVSCNFSRLAEELSKFLEFYSIANFRALDLFPQTPHVEVVIKLVKKP